MLDDHPDFVEYDKTGQDISGQMVNSTFLLPTTTPLVQLNMSRKQHDHSKMEHAILEGAIPFMQTAENPSMILSCIVVVLLCFVMEATKWSRTNSEESRKINRRSNSSRNQSITSYHLVDAILHSVQLTCAYLLMLVFMRCDVWLCASTVAGEVIARLFCTNYLPIHVAPKRISFIDTTSYH